MPGKPSRLRTPRPPGSKRSGARKRSVAKSPLCLLAILASLTSCAGPTNGPTVVNLACLQFAPLYLDAASIAGLTHRDAGQIASHNAIWEAVCPPTAGDTETTP